MKYACTGYVGLISLAALSGCATPMPGRVEPWTLNRPSESPYRQMPEAQAEGWVRQSGKYRIQLHMDPASPKVGQNVSVEFLIWDISKSSATPVQGARMACAARMPNVAGHVHVTESHIDHPEAEPGRYHMHPVQYEMGGRWDVVVQVKAPDGYEFFAVFPIEVEGPPWPPNYMPEELKKRQPGPRIGGY